MSNMLGARRRLGLLQVALVLFAAVLLVADAGVTSEYRRKLEATVEMPLDADVFRIPLGYNAPQQVHITLGDQDGTSMIVSWVTANELGSSTVMYSEASPDPEKMELWAEGTHTRYDYFNYTSGFIHHCNLTNLKYSTKYYYAMGFGHTVRSFCFTTPPMPGPDVPFKFGLIGDLGQTFDSNTTLSHYEANGGDAVLYVGDLSYADNHPLHDNTRWDTWARFVERSAAHQPWVWTAGNHELDLAPELGEPAPFKPTPFWYSVRIASAHVVVLASYSAYGKYTPQWEWLRAELARVDRAATPWLIVLVHSPWYSSNAYHYMEGETMRVQFERWLVAAKADLVVAGHVHAYERSHRVSNVAYDIINGRCTPVRSRDAPVYVTVGDGGNIEGIADNFTQPQPGYSAFEGLARSTAQLFRAVTDELEEYVAAGYHGLTPLLLAIGYSAFREASFGHATLEIMNRTHAYYAWHRNQDGAKVVADGVWFTNRYWMPTDDDTS